MEKTLAPSERIEFNTLDGVTLRGDFYRSQGSNRPIIVMTAGFPMLKEHYITAFAREFQEKGYSALAFDYRGWGSSDGQPRYETDLYRQGDDYRDAVTAAAKLPGVDPTKIVLFGIGHAGAAAIIGAADDPRILGVILQAPAISGRRDATIYGEKVIQQAWRSREERVSTRSWETAYIKTWPTSVTEANDPTAATLFHGDGPFGFISEALKSSEPAGTPWENKVSLQSVLNVTATEARDFLHKIEKPTLYVVFPEDPFTGSADFHRAAANTMGSFVNFVVVQPVMGNTISDFLFFSTIQTQLDFLDKLTN